MVSLSWKWATFFSLQVTHDHFAPVFVNILDLGFDREIAPLLRKQQDLALGNATESGKEFRTRRFRLTKPDICDQIPAYQPIDTIKVFVSSKSLDFLNLQQPGFLNWEDAKAVGERTAVMRGDDSSSNTNIEMLLGNFGSMFRNARDLDDDIPASDWCAVTLKVRIIVKE